MNIPKPEVVLIDTHCHLDMEAYGSDLDEVLDRAKKCGVQHVVTIGIDLPSSHNAIQLAKSYQSISAAVGVHPHDVDNIKETTYQEIGDLVEQNRQYIVGYGEIGLDYIKNYSTIENQQKHFRTQLALARELNLPVIIHDREAHDDILHIIKDVGLPEAGGIMHCFSGDKIFAQKVLKLGLLLSIPGVVTFKNAKSLQEVTKWAPIDALLVETDGPFLSPHPKRGKRNEPAHVAYTARYAAELRNMSFEEFARRTTQNSCRIFNLPIPQPDK
ncbi:TatD family hydrolase [Desulfopila sp. IMCC35008]|uniref:TatD family hydrolase n=1 Tax=Desulfopila sp. IMCC35008 TaxID=2653858 RepID=UPI0013D16847|nr:TatD family hydrolase [Desulfopila sp. IMCC35008]